MKKVTLSMPNLLEVAGDIALSTYPPTYRMPYTLVVREAFTRYRKSFEEGAEFTVPKYGTLTTQGRKFVFTPEPDYRSAKNYPAKIEGEWK